MSKETVMVTANIQIAINDDIPGHKGTIYLPDHPQEWVDRLQSSMIETGQVEMQLNTLAEGCGGCRIDFRHADASYDPEEKKNVFGFIASKDTMIELQRAITYCIQTMND